MRIKELFQRRISTRMYIPCIAVCILVLLFVLLLATAMRSSARARVVQETRNSLAATEYTQLREAIATFDTVGYPSANLMGDILPTLKITLHASNLLDDVLEGEYGAAYALFDDEVYNYIEQTIGEIENAFAQGQSTVAGVDNLRVYMLMLSEGLNGRFDANGNVQPLG